MPKITPIPYRIPLYGSPSDDARTPGLHLTEITRDIALVTNILKEESAERADSEGSEARVAMGIAWEAWIAPRHVDMLYRPGEVKKDGIYLTPDGLSFVDLVGEPVVHEFKLTWKSMRREQDLEAEWLWLTQTMSYCYAYGTRLAQYHIFWVNGDYKQTGARYRLYRLEFSQRELVENWRMVTGHAPVVLRKKETK